MNESKVAATPDKDGNEPVEVDEDEGVKSEPRPTGITNEQSTTLSATLQSFADGALHFLSHASNETLGACLVGISATTYLILGRVGLVIIGVAGGVVLHATWEGVRHDDRDEATKEAEQLRRRETGVEVAKRVLDWKANRTEDVERAKDVKVYATQGLDYSSFGAETATALDTFTNAIIKDYVHYWYDPTIPGEEFFPASCKRTLTAFLLSLSGHLRRKRPADAFLDFATNASSIIIVFLNELSVALSASPNVNAQDAVASYLQLKPDSSLSYMLNEKSQKAKLADAAEDIMQAYLDSKAYNCPPVRVFLEEVLAQLVLGYTVTYCSQPDFINEWIVYGLEESETAKEVMDMVGAGVEGRGDVVSKSAEQIAEKQNAKRRKEDGAEVEEAKRPEFGHTRERSRAEDAMEEAMKEAKRLTQLMMEEDQRKTREEQEGHGAVGSSEDVSDIATQGAPTPTSSQSDTEQSNGEASALTRESTAGESPVTSDDGPFTPNTKQQFTNFDQLVPATPTDSPEKARREQAQLTLYNANISIFDDSVPGERTSNKAKPTIDYLVQVEPSSSAFPGWMIARKYADFEMLHEVLRRISVVTGVPEFTQAHTELPRWRTNTKANLRSELERYLTDAVHFQSLAESEGMKRFLEKDQGFTTPSERAKGFGWPTPDAFGKFGGDMMNVLTKAPKQVAGGGKAVFGGVAGLVGGKRPGMASHQSQASVSRTSTGTIASNPAARQSQESMHSLAKPSMEAQRDPATPPNAADLKPRPSVSSRRASSELTRSVDFVQEAAAAEASPTASQTNIPSLDGGPEAAINLPPPPSEIADDFGTSARVMRQSTDASRSASFNPRASALGESEAAPQTPPPRPHKPVTPKPDAKPKGPLTERETSVAIELMFAVITELYTLSSAWQIRRTLLAAAKNFLLRPGNPQLITIRDMLQQSLLDHHLSDAGIAAQIYKLRENGLPTTEELEAWKRDYPEKTPEQKEELRVKARKLLVTKGMPQALTSVMGAAASGEALGKVFDCLQVPEVGRGLVFGLLLQALRIITH